MNDPRDGYSMLSEAIRHYNTLCHRAEINLKDAHKRNDEKAIQNINRKLNIYKYTLSVLRYYGQQIDDDAKKIAEAGRVGDER